MPSPRLLRLVLAARRQHEEPERLVKYLSFLLLFPSEFRRKRATFPRPTSAGRSDCLHLCVSGVYGLSVHADCSDWVDTGVPDRAAGAPQHRRLHGGRRHHRDRGEVTDSACCALGVFLFLFFFCECEKLERRRSASVILSGLSWSSRPIRSAWPDRCSSPGSWSGTSCLGRCPTGSAGDLST